MNLSTPRLSLYLRRCVGLALATAALASAMATAAASKAASSLSKTK